MAGRETEHVEQLQQALAVLGANWQPDQVTDDATRAVMLATALLGVAKAHLVGAEMDAEQAGADIETLRTAYGPVHNEVVAAAMPVTADTEQLLLVVVVVVRLGRPVTDLSRAAGPDEQAPDIEALAAARDLASAATAMVTHHYAASFDDGFSVPLANESLGLAFAMVYQAAGRLARIAQLPPDDEQDQ
ncbi:hypothetical protein ACFC1R_08820 [Kitasatospora sp. NPDC056138]|uniref:hypothetical protein n=1 Tax=Kitasatospora sp. NPDC056138 TaxID=3345724 RepID=UPI0035D9406E